MKYLIIIIISGAIIGVGNYLLKSYALAKFNEGKAYCLVDYSSNKDINNLREFNRLYEITKEVQSDKQDNVIKRLRDLGIMRAQNDR